MRYFVVVKKRMLYAVFTPELSAERLCRYRVAFLCISGGLSAEILSEVKGRSQRNFLLSATASSSQRLLFSFSAWPAQPQSSLHSVSAYCENSSPLPCVFAPPPHPLWPRPPSLGLSGQFTLSLGCGGDPRLGSKAEVSGIFCSPPRPARRSGCCSRSPHGL